MTGPSDHTPWTLRICRAWIAALARLVPWRLRDDWTEEWHSEIECHWDAIAGRGDRNDWNRLNIIGRSMGAFFDALWLARHERSTDMLFHDIRYSIRSLVRRPVYPVTVVFILALAIGANTAVFSVLKAVVIEPLPYKKPDSLVRIWDSNPEQGGALIGPSPGNMQDWERRNSVFDGIAAWYAGKPKTLAADTQVTKIQIADVTAQFFKVFGTEPVLGRSFSEEEVATQEPVVVMSHGMWQRRFGADPGIVGATISLDGKAHTVLGVMPPEFAVPHKDAELWMPWDFNTGYAARGSVPRDFRFLDVAARLKPGVSLSQAQAEMDEISVSLAAAFPAVNAMWGVRVVPLKDDLVGRFGYVLIVLLGAVGFVLLIACSNIANMSIARSMSRSREFALRSALGASSPRLFRQILTESLLLSFAGGAAGLLLAYGGVDLLLRLAPAGLPRIDEVRVDEAVLGFNPSVSLIAGMICGSVPAFQGAHGNLSAFLNEGGRGATGSRRQNRIRQGLVAGEIALAFILLVGAGLMIRSFVQLLDVESGFNPEDRLLVRVFPEEARFDGPQRVQYFAQVYDALRALPGVAAVGATTGLPLNEFNNSPARPYWREGEERPAGDGQRAPLAMTSAGYFNAIGMTLLQGRDFDDRDRADAPAVAIVNRALARRIYGNENALGQLLIIDYGARGAYPYEIIGVVGDVRGEGPRQDPSPEIYLSHGQVAYAQMNIVVQTAGNPMALAEAARQAVLTVDASQPVHSITTMEQLLAGSIAQDRFAVLLVSSLALLALISALSGIYGIVSYSVSDRSREIGVRMALGASRGSIVRMVMTQSGTVVTAGIALGLPLSVLMAGTLNDMLFGVTPTDPMTFVAVPLLLAAPALIASYLPVRRALRLDPVRALRDE